MISNNYEKFKGMVDELIEKYKGDMGCHVSFTGFVRNYNIDKEGHKIPTDNMVIPDILDILEDIRKDAIEKFNLLDVAIYHNKGTLKVGDVVSSIYVFARHRKEGFLACEYIIDKIKKYH
ncbi:molybdenum cofactor biosynthesis protein MoaE [Methanothermococcus okinawensis]|uniref:Molybdopterin biosynthesis MoaE protein n=1 Tax=Methanothermococcus okinawensis (strain DSM 14208 / JCM 11175 / IH1) TaxID=647113 RepID=F8AJY2_METOI|nr:molybdenum cofactor biosynthesis protein MoaE [Methanothermococcus okinawensis]AEH07338.1 molybdopterin biosynthesis MoaE protein [Methanothermococcus okinawensis IH1]